jgi:hypothetical protein
VPTQRLTTGDGGWLVGGGVVGAVGPDEPAHADDNKRIATATAAIPRCG